MKPDRNLIDEIEKDLRLSPTGKVLYLEGTTDVPVFLGLVGHPCPRRSSPRDWRSMASGFAGWVAAVAPAATPYGAGCVWRMSRATAPFVA